MKKTTHLLCAFLSMAAPSMAATIAEWNFNTNGDTEGWAVFANVTGLTNTSGSLTGTTSNGDPQLRVTGLNLSLGIGQTWDTVVLRIRETDETPATVTPFSNTGLVVQFNGGRTNGVNLFGSVGTAVDSGSGFFTATVDVSGLPESTTVTSLRIDPIGGPDASGNSFKVDFIQVNSIPEPSSALLGCLGLICLLRRRR